MTSPYELMPCNGVIPYGKLEYLHNLQILALDVTEKQIFDFRFKQEEPQLKFGHEPRIKAPLLRIGFISRDFSDHRPSGQLAGEFFYVIREMAAKYNIQVFLYSTFRKILGIYRRVAIIRESRNINRLGYMIRNDRIDILIDMQGHMTNNFNHILELKPAPVIIHWIGYPGTLGLKCVDYHIADKIIIPPESTPYYREKIAYLNHCYQVNNSTLLVNTSLFTRSHYNYPEDKFIFTNFNDEYKLNKKLVSVWMEILKRVPNSIILFHNVTDGMRELILKDAKEYGIDEDRIIKPTWIERREHINRLALTDCGLDTDYCNGHTTSSDLIAAGVPVITVPGNTYQARVTKSLLLAIDVPELICNTWEEYIDKAVELATNPEYHKQIKSKIVENRRKILYNPRMYAENFIKLLLNIWKNHYGTDLPEGVESMEVTKFGNHKKDQNYKWVFYPKKDSPGNNIEKVELRYQELRDYADNHSECVAFNTSGEIKKSVVELDKLVDWGTEEDDGIWIKQFI